MKCEYGCGKKAKYTLKNGRKICNKSSNSCPVVRKKNSEQAKRNNSIKNFKNSRHKCEKKVKCEFCEKISIKLTIGRHQKSCYKNPKNIKKCPICNSLVKDWKNSKTCSRSCANKHSKGSGSKIRLKMNESSARSRTLPEISKKCLNCQKVFKTKKRKQKLCSKSCSSSHTNKKRKFSQEKKQKHSEIIRKQFESGRKVTGGKTKWKSYKGIKIQGTYELRTCKILDRWKKEGKIKDWEYTNDRIQYRDIKNVERSYLLDFKIIESKDRIYYLETKGYKTDNDDLKWKTTRDQGHELIVWFLEDIEKYEKKN